MQTYKISYKWAEKNNALKTSWSTTFSFVKAASEDEAIEEFNREWDHDLSDFELISINEKSLAGRPSLPVDVKKKQVTLKLSPWINDWLNANSQSKATLIEEAVIKQYGLTPPE
ncbi:hypothetical protein [Moritella viscosa]|uniref:50S ribosomal protein L23 n=1 Tax=Moritella viscosa TaxID=80854 RepID=A0ABY1HKY5_9GAMM|nr:hypothetical protein [Moritella viscosa]SGZ01372.1 50S ribosomal protein L23 [Moritella viscosa]